MNAIKKFPPAAKIFLLLLLLGVGWFGYKSITKTKTAEVRYATATVTKGTVVQTVSGSGQVSSANNTPIVTQVTGAITKLYVQNGEEVKSGQAIAQIELDTDSRQKYIQALSSYQSAKNNLASAQASLDSLKSAEITAQKSYDNTANHPAGHVNKTDLKTAQLDLEAAKAKYDNQQNVIEQAQTSLSNASMNLRQVSPTIYAPISGTLTGLSLQEGSVIPAQAVSGSNSNQAVSQNIAVITTSSVPLITVDLTEIDIPKVNIGQKATITFDAFPDKTYTGKVLSINTTGSVSSGVTSYPTTITLDTDAPEIYANMSAAANIITASKSDVLMVPTSSIQSQNEQQTVRVLKNGVPETVNVETGLSSDSETEIISGLSEGDIVVTSVITPSTGTGNTGGSSPFGTFRGGFGGGGGVRINGR